MDRNEQSTVSIALLCIGICIAFQMVVSLLPVGDIKTIFRNRSSTLMGQPRGDERSSSTSQPSITLAPTYTVTTLLPTNWYPSFSVQSSPNSQLPTSAPPLPQSDSVASMSSSAGLYNKEVLRDSASHNPECSSAAH